jgi:hypothetical protein
MRIKTTIIAFLLLGLTGQFLFSLDTKKDYIVVSNNVNVLEDASVNAEILRQVSFPEIFKVYEIRGSGVIKNGVLDKWVKISMEKSEWLNYYYIVSFPFVVSSNEYYEQYVDDFNTLIIEDFYFQNNQLYFKIEKNVNTYYYKDAKFVFPAKTIIQGISMIDNPWTRLCDFCEHFDGYLYLNKIDKKLYTDEGLSTIIQNDSVILDYGVQVGMTIENVKDIFGLSYVEKDDFFHYTAAFVGHGYQLYFYFDNGRVVKIIHEVEK